MCVIFLKKGCDLCDTFSLFSVLIDVVESITLSTCIFMNDNLHLMHLNLKDLSTAGTFKTQEDDRNKIRLIIAP